MIIRKVLLGFAALSLTVPIAATAQDNLIVVTGTRVERDDYDEFYDDEQSAIGLTRQADFFVKPIYVNSDSREEDVRKQEVTAMLRATIERAERAGISLVAGDYRLKPLTLATIDDLSFGRGRRPDTTRVQFYARLPVGSRFHSIEQVDKAVEPFTEAVPVNGRSYIETGETSLAIDNPQQYRSAVVKAIAGESRRYAEMFGSDYGIQIRGLDSELYFNQASETEVFLYIAHSFIIEPK